MLLKLNIKKQHKVLLLFIISALGLTTVGVTFAVFQSRNFVFRLIFGVKFCLIWCFW